MSTQRQRTIGYRWSPDDTEEGVVGADWHQEAIVNLWAGLYGVASRRGWPWHVGNQLTLVAAHPDGTIWRPKPDIMVHPQAGPERHEEIAVRDAGVPALIIEVASPSTWRGDIGMDPRYESGAKAFEYLALGVPEYLVFDPMGEFLEGQCRAWQQSDGRVNEWRPEPDGLYHSALHISFRPDGLFLRVFDPDGNPVPFVRDLY